VVSGWHLIETAHTTNLSNALELAEFIDSLSPVWLLERLDLLKLEIEDDFCRYLGLSSPHRPRITTRSAAIAALLGKKDSPKFDIPSPKFVVQWIEHPEQLNTLEQTYAHNAKSLIRLRQLAKDGKITKAIRNRTTEIIVRALLPEIAPAGLTVDPASESDYVKQVQIHTIPTLAIETAISEQEWVVRDGSGVDRNTLIDKFHLISALPYVDEVITNDKFFYKVFPAAQNTGHVKAKVVRNEEFLKRF